MEKPLLSPEGTITPTDISVVRIARKRGLPKNFPDLCEAAQVPDLKKFLRDVHSSMLLAYGKCPDFIGKVDTRLECIGVLMLEKRRDVFFIAGILSPEHVDPRCVWDPLIRYATTIAPMQNVRSVQAYLRDGDGFYRSILRDCGFDLRPVAENLLKGTWMASQK